MVVKTLIHESFQREWTREFLNCPCTYERKSEVCSPNHRCCGKAVLGLHILRVCRLSYPARKAQAPWPVWLVPYFFTLSYKRHDCWGGVLEHTMHVLISSTNFFWNISHSKTNWARYHNKCTWVSTSSIRYSCQILMKLEFSFDRFTRITQIWNCMKIRLVGAGLFHADGQTDRWTWRS